MLHEKFCQRLRLLRLDRGFSQENMAVFLNMSTSGYAKIERGETTIGLDRVEQIAKALEVEIGFSGYFGGDNLAPMYQVSDHEALIGLHGQVAQYEKEILKLKEKMGMQDD